MRVIAFVGPSGTGKSHRALNIAHEYKIESIIDDGLLIKGTRILAGISAKKEENKIQAVKRAIFYYSDHTKNVKDAIEKYNVQSILIIGTSDKMIFTICKKLKIPIPSEIIRIENVATPYEMKKARKIRIKEGKHIIPVSTIELRPHFTGILVDLPHHLLNARKRKSLERVAEKSIVRPAFSYYGKLSLSDYVIIDIITIILKKNNNISKTNKIKVRRSINVNDGMTINLELNLFYGINIIEIIQQIQDKIKRKVEFMTAMPVKEINVQVRSLNLKSENK